MIRIEASTAVPRAVRKTRHGGREGRASLTHRLSIRSLLLSACISLLLLPGAGCRNEPPPPLADRDLIEAFEPAGARLGRQAIPFTKGCPLALEGCRIKADEQGAFATAPEMIIRFDSPWTTSRTALDLVLRAESPCRADIRVNDVKLGSVRLGKGETTFSSSLAAGVLQPFANQLVVAAPQEAGVRLITVILPPVGETITAGRHRVRTIPAQPPSEIRFRLEPGLASRLRLEPLCWVPRNSSADGELIFEVELREPGETNTLYRHEVKLEPGRRPEATPSVDLPLPASGADSRELALITRFEPESAVPVPASVGWGRPMIVPEEARTPRPTSIVIWLVDTLRADHLGCYGYERETSPRLDAFAADAIRFEQFISQSSWTKASVASMMTGLFPSSHGAVGRNDKLMPHVTTLAQVLHAEGYRTAAFSSNGVFHARAWDLCRGFEEVWTYLNRDNAGGKETLAIMADVAAWLEQNGDDPLFLFIHTVDPHMPYHPAEPYNRKFGGHTGGRFTRGVVTAGHLRGDLTDADLQQVVALYDGEIAFSDACFGDFLDRLRSFDLFDDTLIVFVSDHGEEFRDHGGWGHGVELYQEQIRLPLVVRLPGGRSSGRVIHGRLRELDLMPTLLEWLDLEPLVVEGESFAALIDQLGPVENRDALSEQALDNNRLYSLVSGNYKYILRVTPTMKESLYDISTDPEERRDLARQLPDVTRALATRVQEHRDSVESGFRAVFVSETPRTVRGTVLSESPIIQARAIDKKSLRGFSYGLSEDQRRLWFVLPANKRPHGIIFNMEQVGAGCELSIETPSGEDPLPVFLGPGRVPAPAGSIPLDDQRLLAEGPIEGLEASRTAGCYIWRVPGGGPAEAPLLTPEERENLKVLGYLE